MKHVISHKFVLVLLALSLFRFATHAFVVDGIAYRLSGDAAIVTSGGHYTGVVRIPEHVRYLGRNYVVSGIDERAFYDCDRIYSVFMPESLQFIGEAAFAHCDSLISITVPDQVELLADSALAYCPNLEVTLLGRGIKRIGHGALWHAGDALLSNPRLVILSDTPPAIDAEQIEYMLMESPFCYILLMHAFDQIAGTNWQRFRDIGRCSGTSPFVQDGSLGRRGHAYAADRDYIENTDADNAFRFRQVYGSLTDWMEYDEYMSCRHYDKLMRVEVMPKQSWFVPGVNRMIRGEYFASICTNNNAFGKAKIPSLYAEAQSFIYEDNKIAGAYHQYRATGKSDSARFIVIYKNHFHVLHDIYSDPTPSQDVSFNKLYYNYQSGGPEHPYIVVEEVPDTLHLPVGKRIELFYQQSVIDCSGTIDNRDVLDGWFAHENYYGRLCALSGTKSGVAHIRLHHQSGMLPPRTITVIVGNGSSSIEQVGVSKPWRADAGKGLLHLQGLTAGESVEVCNLQGMVVKRFVANAAQCTIDGLLPGIYITRHMMQTAKSIIH